MAAVQLTELESCTLSVIRSYQPCSAYEVRQVFARSVTPEWSGSTGAIYPVVNRLLKQGLARKRSAAGDRRRRADLTVTQNGERAIFAWVTTLEPRHATSTPDPIRTRSSFLGLLPSNEHRARFISAAEALTAEMAEEVRKQAETERETDKSAYIATLGALFQLEARLRWLSTARALLQLPKRKVA